MKPQLSKNIALSFALITMLLAVSCTPHPHDLILDQLEAVVLELEKADIESDPSLLGRVITRIEELRGQLKDYPSSLDENRQKRSASLLERSIKALDALTASYVNKFPDQ